MLVSEVFDPVIFILNDRKMVTYTESDLMSALNNSLRMVVSVRPDACTDIGIIELYDGSKQVLPDHALRLLDGCYLLDSGERVVSALELTNRQDLDRISPMWQVDPPSEHVTEIMYDERFPRFFWTYPPAIKGTKLQIAYSMMPETVNSKEDSYPISDKYVPASIEWMLYMLFSRDAENSINQQRATDHRSVFFGVMQAKTQSDTIISPVQQSSG